MKLDMTSENMMAMLRIASVVVVAAMTMSALLKASQPS
ncbi:MAG: hypothetical protein RLZZ352_2410 [Pseudomonadota bacterium]|jgi:hypothetical protein